MAYKLLIVIRYVTSKFQLQAYNYVDISYEFLKVDIFMVIYDTPTL